MKLTPPISSRPPAKPAMVTAVIPAPWSTCASTNCRRWPEVDSATAAVLPSLLATVPSTAAQRCAAAAGSATSIVSPVMPPGACSGARPVHDGPAHLQRIGRLGPVQGHDRAGDILGVQVRAGDVWQVGRPDDPQPQVGHPATGRRQVRHLEYRHVPAVATAPLKVPARGSVRLDRRYYLHECVASREHGIEQAEPCHPWIVERPWPAECLSQIVGYPAAVARHQGHLAQARTVQRSNFRWSARI